MSNNDLFGDLMYAFTRKQAVEDGEQFELSSIDPTLATMAKELYKYPIYLTRPVHYMIEKAVNNEKHRNDWAGVLWDILWMSQRVGKGVDARTTVFDVKITGVGRKKWYRLYIQCGPTDIDRPEPALTIMTPEEYQMS